MKKGQVCKGTVEHISYPNKARVRITEVLDIPDSDDIGALVTVKNCLPDQTVLFRITKKRKGSYKGNLISIIKNAPNETERVCKNFGRCGGCSYLSLDYDSQISIKEDQLKEIFSPIIGTDVWEELFEGIKRSPNQYAYRNKMEFSFGDEIKDGPLTLGMHVRQSFYDVVTVSDCMIVDSDYRLILDATLNYCRTQELTYYHRINHTGYLRHLIVRKAIRSGEILVCLVTSSQCNDSMIDTILSQWSDIIKSLCTDGKVVGILHTINDSLSDAVINESTDILYGRDYITEELLGLSFKISAYSFFQTNSLGAEVLYNTVREFIGDDVDSNTCLYDLYSGTGTIAQMMARHVNKVIGVELIGEAVKAARDNTVFNNLSNCTYIEGDVLNVLDSIEDKPDYIILDPPRDGINPKALSKIIDYGVDNIIYISCKPTSLARDLEALLQSYDIKRVAAVDMFPQTGHVETVVCLSKGDVKSKKIPRLIAYQLEYEKLTKKEQTGEK